MIHQISSQGTEVLLLLGMNSLAQVTLPRLHHVSSHIAVCCCLLLCSKPAIRRDPSNSSIDMDLHFFWLIAEFHLKSPQEPLMQFQGLFQGDRLVTV